MITITIKSSTGTSQTKLASKIKELIEREQLIPCTKEAEVTIIDNMEPPDVLIEIINPKLQD